MLVKFFSRGSGDGESPTNYLLGDLRDREGATVLRGNPEITKEIINATDYARRYTSGCLSFEEAADDITDKTKAWIMDTFEKTLFAGLESDQYNILWVEHKDKNQTDKKGKAILGADGQPIKRQELNFLIPNQELRSGKRLQPFYHWADMMRVNAFQNVVNMKFKFSDPHDPSKRRTTHPYFSRSANLKGFEENRGKLTKRQEAKCFLTEYMYDLAARARLANRAAIQKELKNQGYEVERVTKRSITVSHTKFKRNMRLEDPIFSEDYRQGDYTAAALQRKQERYEQDKQGKILRDSIEILNDGVEEKKDNELSAKGIGAKESRAKLTERQEAKCFLTEYMYDLAARARLANRAAIQKELKNQGYEIERVTKRYISISSPKLKKNIRLDDPIFSEDYDQRNYIAVALQQKQEQYERDKQGKIFRESLDTLNEGIKRKTEYHQKRFGSADVPKPFDLGLGAPASAQTRIDESEPARPKDNSSPSLSMNY